jgi:hypothetical protein
MWRGRDFKRRLWRKVRKECGEGEKVRGPVDYHREGTKVVHPLELSDCKPEPSERLLLAASAIVMDDLDQFPVSIGHVTL